MMRDPRPSRREDRVVASTGAVHLHRSPPNRRAQDPRKIPVPGYTLVKSLSPGGMSQAVNLVKEKSTGKVFIEKRVLVNKHRKRRITAELNALLRTERGGNLNYLVKYLWDERAGFCSFILEYCDGGNLETIIEDHVKSRRNINEGFAWHVLLGMAKGLAFLHHGIRDAPNGKPAES
jgi:serine/threonine protein kinase